MGQNGLRVETTTVNVDSFDSFDKFAILAGSYQFAPKRQFESRGFCTSLSGSILYVCAAVAFASSAACAGFFFCCASNPLLVDFDHALGFIRSCNALWKASAA